MCVKDSECCSQKCVDDVCVPSAEYGRPKWCLVSLFTSYSLFESIRTGQVTMEEGTCPCTDLSDSQISTGLGNLIDHDADTYYVNNYALNAGFFLESNVHSVLREFKVCPGPYVENDPASYKIEGMCDGENRYTLVSEGPVEFDESRNTCFTVAITGRFEFTRYKVTFPTLRGGFGSCEGSSSCKNYPVIVSEVDLLAKCDDEYMAEM